jgi:tRNA (mo5U34)-methyltransferase
MSRNYDALRARWGECAWLEALCTRAEARMAAGRHGEQPRWEAALAGLPTVEPQTRLDLPAPELGRPVPGRQHDRLRLKLMEFHPWRKGPLNLGGIEIDSEWRSDWKWDRVSPHVDLRGHRILDIGCGNGYFGLRMLGAGAGLVIGIDPTLVYCMQAEACRHFSGDTASYVLPLALEELPEQPVAFDTVFSMGVLYHRRAPWRHIERVLALLKEGGTMVLETLVLPAGQEQELLVPEGRYARMRNVWSIPGTARLLQWVLDAGFRQPEIVSLSATTTEEQRSTPWMRFESLEKALDPGKGSRTIEGHPAPTRAVLVARR